VPATRARSDEASSVSGAALLCVAQEKFDEASTRTSARLLLRALLQRAAHGATRAVGHRSRQVWLEYTALIESGKS
jgi:hypothetical protein